MEIKRKVFDHVITKDHPMADLFEELFFKIPERRGIRSSSHQFWTNEDKMEFFANSIGADMIYQKVSGVDRWDGDGKEYKEALLGRVEEFNSKSPRFKVYIPSFSDFEIEPGERTWDATYSIGIAPTDEFAIVEEYRALAKKEREEYWARVREEQAKKTPEEIKADIERLQEYMRTPVKGKVTKCSACKNTGERWGDVCKCCDGTSKEFPYQEGIF